MSHHNGTPIFNPYQVNRPNRDEPRRRADTYTAYDGVTAVAPLRLVVEEVCPTITEALVLFGEHLRQLSEDVAGPGDWELAEWSAVEDDDSEDGRPAYRFTAHYVWVPRLTVPGDAG